METVKRKISLIQLNLHREIHINISTDIETKIHLEFIYGILNEIGTNIYRVLLED